jgi:DNA-binding beta-propeller fold protein YncE
VAAPQPGIRPPSSARRSFCPAADFARIMVMKFTHLTAFLCMVTLAGGAAETPSPALLVLNKNEATLAIVDPTTFEIVVKVPTGDNPHEVAASADGKWAFVSNYGRGGNTISVIDLIAQKEKRVDLGDLRRVHGMASLGNKAIFASESARLVASYDPVTDKVERLVSTDQDMSHMVVVSHDGARMFTSNMGSDSVSVAEKNAAGSWSATVVKVGSGPEGIDLTPDGKEIWTATYGDGNMAILDVALKRVKQTFTTNTRRANRVKITPDGKLALVSDMGGGELVIYDVTARKEVKRLPLGSSPEGVLIEPSGTRAFVAVTGDDQVAVINLKSLTVVNRFSPGRGTGPDGMAWAVR